MPVTDWVTDGIFWWGELLWTFLRNFPPYDWIQPPLYYIKILLYVFPILIIILLPYILWFRSIRKNRELRDQLAKKPDLQSHLKYEKDKIQSFKKY